MGCHFLFQEIFLTEGSNPHLLFWQMVGFFTTETPGETPTLGLFVYYGLPGWLNVKESTCNAGDIETQVRSLGWENPLEKEMATHSSILA